LTPSGNPTCVPRAASVDLALHSSRKLSSHLGSRDHELFNYVVFALPNPLIPMLMSSPVEREEYPGTALSFQHHQRLGRASHRYLMCCAQHVSSNIRENLPALGILTGFLSSFAEVDVSEVERSGIAAVITGRYLLCPWDPSAHCFSPTSYHTPRGYSVRPGSNLSRRTLKILP
jgi:hypothetical protein